LRPPCEIVQREFLPAVRTQLAKALRERGLSQTEISSRLEVTQAAVSKYLNQSDSASELSNEIGDLVQKLANMISNPDTEADAVVKELCSSCMYSRLGSTICRIHQSAVPSLKTANCQICSQLLGKSDGDLVERARVIADMQDALRTIEASTSFERIVPQVRANLVACTLDAADVRDVAGVPGRIAIIGGRAAAIMSPQFGASRHTAEILVKARSIWPRMRACICISGRTDIVEAAIKSGFQVTSIADSESDAARILDSLRKLGKRAGRISEHPGIHVPGGFGIEPILYLFGSTAKELSELCLDVGNSVST